MDENSFFELKHFKINCCARLDQITISVVKGYSSDTWFFAFLIYQYVY